MKHIAGIFMDKGMEIERDEAPRSIESIFRRLSCWNNWLLRTCPISIVPGIELFNHLEYLPLNGLHVVSAN